MALRVHCLSPVEHEAYRCQHCPNVVRCRWSSTLICLNQPSWNGKINNIMRPQWKIDHSKLTELGCVCNVPCWVWFRLHIFHTAIDWHRNWHVQQWRCCSHCMTIVFVINFDVSMQWLTFPIADKLEWSWLSARFSLYRILQNVNVEIGCRWILFRLTTKQLRKGGHVELENCSSAWRLDFVTANRISNGS